MVRLLLVDQLVIQVLEFLQTVVIFENLFDRAVFASQDLLNGCTGLVSITAPKSAIQKSTKAFETLKAYPPKLSITIFSLKNKDSTYFQIYN